MYGYWADPSHFFVKLAANKIVCKLGYLAHCQVLNLLCGTNSFYHTVLLLCFFNLLRIPFDSTSYHFLEYNVPSMLLPSLDNRWSLIFVFEVFAAAFALLFSFIVQNVLLSNFHPIHLSWLSTRKIVTKPRYIHGLFVEKDILLKIF